MADDTETSTHARSPDPFSRAGGQRPRKRHQDRRRYRRERGVGRDQGCAGSYEYRHERGRDRFEGGGIGRRYGERCDGCRRRISRRPAACSSSHGAAHHQEGEAAGEEGHAPRCPRSQGGKGEGRKAAKSSAKAARTAKRAPARRKPGGQACEGAGQGQAGPRQERETSSQGQVGRQGQGRAPSGSARQEALNR